MNPLTKALLIILLFCAVAGAQPAETPQGLRRTPVVTAIARIHESVVNISTEQVVDVRRGFGPTAGFEGDVFDRMFQDFFQGPAVERRRVQSPLGSGVIISSDGLVITNEHVIRRATDIKLSLDSGESFDAVLLAADATSDIALLRAKSEKPMKAAVMGTSSDLMLGETAIALGNPFGFENSATTGILSAFNREIEVGAGGEKTRYAGLVQTSALINPGNSGGPLVNVLGELIGINTAVVDQAQGIGFAIPIDRVRDLLAPLMGMPQVSKAWCGLHGETVEGRKGMHVTEVEAGSPAAAVVQVTDIIIAIDGQAVRDPFDVLLHLVQRTPEDLVSLRVARAGTTTDIRIKLGVMPQPSPRDILHDRLGIAGKDLTPPTSRRSRIATDHGLVVSEVTPNGPSARAGLQEGDVIIQIGPHPVRTVQDAASALQVFSPGDRVSVLVVRQNYYASGRIEIGK